MRITPAEPMPIPNIIIFDDPTVTLIGFG